MGSLVTRAAELAAELNQLGVRAVADPADALVNLPCILVAPPRVDYRTKAVTWRLLVLGPGPGTLAGWTAVDTLLDALAAEAPLETAEPATYQLPNLGEPVACYIASYTETA